MGKETVLGDPDAMIKADIDSRRKTLKLIREYRMRKARSVATRYDKGRKAITLNVGETVYLYDHTVGKLGGKLTRRWTGPWIIQELRGSNAAVLFKDGKSTVQNVASIMQLGPPWDPVDTKRGPIGGPEKEIENEEIAEMSRILEEKTTDKELDDLKILQEFNEEESKRWLEKKKLMSHKEVEKEHGRTEKTKKNEDDNKDERQVKRNKGIIQKRRLPRLKWKTEHFRFDQIEVGMMIICQD